MYFGLHYHILHPLTTELEFRMIRSFIHLENIQVGGKKSNQTRNMATLISIDTIL